MITVISTILFVFFVGCVYESGRVARDIEIADRCARRMLDSIDVVSGGPIANKAKFDMFDVFWGAYKDETREGHLYDYASAPLRKLYKLIEKR